MRGLHWIGGLCLFVSLSGAAVADVVVSTSNLPPTQGVYANHNPIFEQYVNGVLLRQPVLRNFSASIPPPPPGGSQNHSYSSLLDGQYSVDGGATFQSFTANAAVVDRVTSTSNVGNTRNFSDEILQLTVSGGTLPPGAMLRESPTLVSPGQTSITDLSGAGGPYQISSFFDVFTELSLDGGQTWIPATGSGRLTLEPEPAIAPLLISTLLLFGRRRPL